MPKDVVCKEKKMGEPICFRPEQTIKIDGGAQLSLWNQENTKHRNVLLLKNHW